MTKEKRTVTMHKKSTKLDIESEENRWMLASRKVNKLILKDEPDVDPKNFQ